MSSISITSPRKLNEPRLTLVEDPCPVPSIIKVPKVSLREHAYALRFDPNDMPPPDETCMAIGEIPIAARGNLSGVQGKSKVGKSAVMAAILGAALRGNYQAQGDTLCIHWTDRSEGAIVHLDTEQSRSDWHALVRRGIKRSGVDFPANRLISLPLVQFARSERMAILQETLEFEKARTGAVDVVVIDGVADLCKSPNDEAEALELVSSLMALAQRFDCAIFCVLHENPGTDQGKTRGHLGSELNRKAFANLRIDKEAETSVSTLYGLDMRKREIPKDQGFCFGWEDKAGMHVFKGRATGIKAAKREAKAVKKAREEWEALFNFLEDQGTETGCLGLSPELAALAERDMKETEKATATSTMKKRMQRAETIGVLKKTQPGHWALKPAGQEGQSDTSASLSP